MVGAIVLTALAIIILPMLLDGSARDRAKVVARIPQPPGIQLKKLTVADIDQRMKQMEAGSAAKVPHLVPSPPEAVQQPVKAAPADNSSGNKTPQSAAPGAGAPAVSADVVPAGHQADQLSLDKNNLPVSWSLQLASFKNQENALKLRSNLRASHYRSYIIAARTDQGEMYRVYVGPMLEKARLAEIGKQIEHRFDLKGQIVRYRIEDDAGQLGG